MGGSTCFDDNAAAHSVWMKTIMYSGLLSQTCQLIVNHPLLYWSGELFGATSQSQHLHSNVPLDSLPGNDEDICSVRHIRPSLCSLFGSGIDVLNAQPFPQPGLWTCCSMHGNGRTTCHWHSKGWSMTFMTVPQCYCNVLFCFVFTSGSHTVLFFLSTEQLKVGKTEKKREA